MTLEELKAAIMADKDLLTGVVGILKEGGNVVRTADEEKSFLENYEKNVLPQKIESGVEEKIKVRVSEIASRVEQDFLEASGIPKNEGEKYYEYIKRGASTLKESKGSDTEQLLKDRLKLYEEKAVDLEKKLTEQVEGEKTRILDFKKNSIVGEALRGLDISYPSHITTDEAKSDYRSMIERTIQGDFQSRFLAKDNEGEVVFYEGESPLLDTATNKYLSPKAIIEKNFGIFIAPKQEQKGGLGEKPNTAAAVGKMTSEQYDSYAESKGWVLGSKEYGTGYQENVGL